MGSLTETGQIISQDTNSTKHVGHSIEVTDYSTDTLVSRHPLAEGGEGLNP